MAGRDRRFAYRLFGLNQREYDPKIDDPYAPLWAEQGKARAKTEKDAALFAKTPQGQFEIAQKALKDAKIAVDEARNKKIAARAEVEKAKQNYTNNSTSKTYGILDKKKEAFIEAEQNLNLAYINQEYTQIAHNKSNRALADAKSARGGADKSKVKKPVVKPVKKVVKKPLVKPAKKKVVIRRK